MGAVRAAAIRPAIEAGHSTHDHQDSQDSQGITKKNREPIAPNCLRLPLKDYIEWVLEFLESSAEEPEYPRWHSPLFRFTRLVRAHPEVAELKETEALAAVERALASIRREHDLGVGKNAWNKFFSVEDEDEARLDFMYCWSKIRHIPFVDLLANAIRIADERPIHPPVNRTPLYGRFISLAYWLQRMVGDRPIILPVRKVANTLGCHPSMVSILRGFAVQDGFLVVAKEHRFKPTMRSSATEFRVIGESRERKLPCG